MINGGSDVRVFKHLSGLELKQQMPQTALYLHLVGVNPPQCVLVANWIR